MKKTGRRTGKCGECKYFNGGKNVCTHPQMENKQVNAYDMLYCAYYSPIDDYDNN